MRSPIYMYIYISDMILYTRKLLILILVFNVCCVHLRSLRSLPDLPPLSYTQWVVGPKKTRDFAVDSSWSNHVRILCVFFFAKKIGDFLQRLVFETPTNSSRKSYLTQPKTSNTRVRTQPKTLKTCSFWGLWPWWSWWFWNPFFGVWVNCQKRIHPSWSWPQIVKKLMLFATCIQFAHLLPHCFTGCWSWIWPFSPCGSTPFCWFAVKWYGKCFSFWRWPSSWL